MGQPDKGRERKKERERKREGRPRWHPPCFCCGVITAKFIVLFTLTVIHTTYCQNSLWRSGNCKRYNYTGFSRWGIWYGENGARMQKGERKLPE